MTPASASAASARLSRLLLAHQSAALCRPQRLARQVAREHDLLAYVVVHDATLEAQVGVSGMGAKKFEAYGQESCACSLALGTMRQLSQQPCETHIVRNLQEFRLDVTHTAFKVPWETRDYAPLIAVAKTVPDAVRQEGKKLLPWYAKPK